MNAFRKFQIVLLIGFLPFYKSFSQGISQDVKITNLEGVNGSLYIGWYNKDTDFPINDKAIFKEKLKVNNLSDITINFENIPSGEYAIAVFLDENNDYKLNRNLFGIPKEKYGFSNNVLPKFRAATFKEATISLTNKRSTVVINLK